MQLTHLGHASVLVQTNSARLVIDPGSMAQVTGLIDIDAVLITHQHADHLDLVKLRQILALSPRARVIVDPDTVTAVGSLPPHAVAAPGDRLRFGSTVVQVLGGRHAPVYRDAPGCTNSAYLIDDGALLHPGDSFWLPARDIDVLAVAVDGPWLKLGEAIEYVLSVSPRVAIPIHDGETTDPAKCAGMLDRLTGGNTVCRLPAGRAVELS